MAYNKQNFRDGQTLTAEMLNKIEAGIVQNENSINNIKLIPGPQGPKGDTGATGPQGEPGAPADLTGYATEQFVKDQIANAQLGGEGDPSDYLTETEADDKYQPKGDYLTEHQKLKTINGQSLIGEGDIVIEGGSRPLPDPTIILEWEVGALSPGDGTPKKPDGYTNVIRTAGFSTSVSRTIKIKLSGTKNFIYVFENGQFILFEEDVGATTYEIKLASGKQYHIAYAYSTTVVLEDVNDALQYINIEGLGAIYDTIPNNLAGTTHRFKVTVNCAAPADGNTIGLQDSVTEYEDDGFIMFPDSYSESGTPTRLIISCHGAGGTVTTNDSQVEHAPTTKYLVANGYAVMDVNGLPSAYASANGIDDRNNIGSPIAMQCYIKAYHYCMERFNLHPEVFLFGASMGGISSTNLCMSGSIPVIAHGAYCPVLDTYNQIFLKPWSDGLPKTALGKFYGLASDGNGYIYDEEKVRGYNPVSNRTITVGDVKYTDYPVPVKFWHCQNDTTVSISVTRGFVEAIRRMGRTAYLREFSTGGHEPQDVGSNLANPFGNTNFRGETVPVKPAVEEVLLWFNRYN